MAIPSMLAGCKVLERIGAGAESVIYKARDFDTGQLVAIKHLVVETKENRKYLRHVRNEFNVLKAIEDSNGAPPPGIVKAFRLERKGLLRKRKEYILVMEYVDGLDLGKENRFPLGQIVDIASQTAKALGALHSRGFVHGDIKPENIIVTHDGRATLVDFGFACKIGSQLERIRGTRDYIAPEQIHRGIITERTDIYNFGATLYFLLTGRHVPAIMAPQGDSGIFITSRKSRAEPPQTYRPEIPPALDQIVMRCLMRTPIDRPSCIEEVDAVLTDVRNLFAA